MIPWHQTFITLNISPSPGSAQVWVLTVTGESPMLQTSTVDRATVAPTAFPSNPKPTPLPFPMPTYPVGSWVQTEQISDDTQDLDSSRWVLHPAIVCGAQWDARHREWQYFLFFPQRPNQWLPDGFFDTCPVLESSLWPMTYRLAA